MKKYIVKSSFNWADEIDLTGFDLFTEDELKDTKKALKNLSLEVKGYIGTNEDIDIEASDVLEELDCAKEISDGEYAFLKSLFSDHYGKTLCNMFFNSCDYDDYLEKIEKEKIEKQKKLEAEKRKKEREELEQKALFEFEKILGD